MSINFCYSNQRGCSDIEGQTNRIDLSHVYNFYDNCRDLYIKKLQLIYNSQLPNLYDLLGWKNKVFSLPGPDFYNYLINHPSGVFTNKSLKAYKSLDAYNYFVLGNFQEVYYHETKKDCKCCFIKSEVDTLCDWDRYIPSSFFSSLDRQATPVKVS